jgi:hypothetical protein
MADHGGHTMGSILYEIAEGVEIPAEYAEDLARELEFAAAANTLADAGHQALDLARDAAEQAEAQYLAACDRAALAYRTKDLADSKVRALLSAAGLVRTAAGIMPQAITDEAGQR